METVFEAINCIRKKLAGKDIPNSLFEAQEIVARVVSIPRLEIYLYSKQTVKPAEKKRLNSILEQRLAAKPLQYIFGEAGFRDIILNVSPAVLIPRPETELLVQRIIDDRSKHRNKPISLPAQPQQKLRILDIGCGSGAIAISLAKQFPEYSIDAVDISGNILKLAEKNAAFNKVQVQFILSDLFENVSSQYDIIVSNPPYISKKDYQFLPAEIVEYEPKKALVAEEEGLYFYRSILSEANHYLRPHGTIYFEIGSKQAESITGIAAERGFQVTKVDKDYNNLERVLTLVRSSCPYNMADSMVSCPDK